MAWTLYRKTTRHNVREGDQTIATQTNDCSVPLQRGGELAENDLFIGMPAIPLRTSCRGAQPLPESTETTSYGSDTP